jgi:ATP-dependent exoDNAse (exonuclease V) beta subunit
VEIHKNFLEKNVFLPASAGSGKTTQIVRFYLFAVLEQGIDPRKILAISYTNKSSYELKERIIKETIKATENKISSKQQKELLYKIYDAQISTIHSFALNILKKYPIEFKINPNIKIIEGNFEDRSKKLGEFIQRELLRILKKPINQQEKEIQKNIKNTLNYISWNELCKYVKQTIDDPYLLYYEQEINEAENENIFSETIFGDIITISKYIYANWEEKAKQIGEIGYDDIENIFLRGIKENPELHQKISSLYEKVFVDEYQDISPIEYEILFELWKKEKKLFLVGDVKQSIYSFRKADYRIFIATQESFKETNEIVFEEKRENYRSSKKIIKEVNNIFKIIFNDSNYSYQESIPKAKFSEEVEKEAGVYYIKLLYSSISEREEKIAEFIAHKIRTIPSNQKTIAILSHKSNSFKAISYYLKEKHNIPAESKDNSYWDFLSIREIILFLKSIIYPDDFYLFGILISPFVGLTINEAIYVKENQNLQELFSSAPRNVSMLPKEKLRRLSHTISIYKDITKIYDLTPTYKVIEYITKKSPIQSYLREHQEEWEAYEHFIEEIYQESKGGYLPIWKIENIAKINTFSREIEKEAVGLYTIHSAKGLEFDIVFLIDVELGRKQTKNNLAYMIPKPNNHNGKLSFELIYIYEKLWKDEIKDLKLYQKYAKKGKEILKRENVSEIKRLLYVAYTRPKEKLYVITTEPINNLTKRSQDETKFQTILEKAKKIKWKEEVF